MAMVTDPVRGMDDDDDAAATAEHDGGRTTSTRRPATTPSSRTQPRCPMTSTRRSELAERKQRRSGAFRELVDLGIVRTEDGMFADGT